MVTVFYYYSSKLGCTVYRLFDSITGKITRSYTSIPNLLLGKRDKSEHKTLQEYINVVSSVNSINVSDITIIEDISETYPEYFI